MDTAHRATSGGGETFDPRQAAALLDHTTQQTRGRLQPSPPWLLVVRAVLVLMALGGVWLSVRNQHPYTGPTYADAIVLVAFVVANFVVTVVVRSRALTGVAGRSRWQPTEITVAALAWLAVVLLIVVLAAAGVSYVDHPTSVLIIPGVVWAGLMARRRAWLDCATGLAVAVVGVAGLLADPAGSWAVAAVGLCAVLLARAAVIRWRQRA